MSHELLNLNADAPVEEVMVLAVAARLIEEAVEGPPARVPHDSGDPIHLTEAQAATRLSQGLQFAAEDDVTMRLEGTDAIATLADLNMLGIDHVVADLTGVAAGDIEHNQGDIRMELGMDTIGTGEAAAAAMLTLFESFDEPIFVDAASVGVTLSQAESNAFDAASDAVQDDIVTRLADLGVDFVNVVGTAAPDDAAF